MKNHMIGAVSRPARWLSSTHHSVEYPGMSVHAR